jgi:membrane-bound lytic murein transglycosylase A
MPAQVRRAFHRCAFVTVLTVLAACAGREEPAPVPQPEETAEAVLQLSALSFDALPGWNGDDQGGALAAFQVSCGALEKKDPGAAMGGQGSFGTVADWLGACAAARQTPPEGARGFFESWFRPWRASASGDPNGLFTGYYEPLLSASATPDARYRFPLYRRPTDMLVVDLGAFSSEFDGRTITGRLADGSLLPYWDRTAIDDGALGGQGLEIAWTDDEVALFFLHIQGSGRLAMTDGRELRVGYDGQNGHGYYAIGRELVAMGELTKEEVSLQSIRDWLKANPEQADAVMQTNPSYIFFRVLEGPGPIGGQGVPLTPGRSLAVDHRIIAYGAPLWLDTSLPDGTPWQRLMIAQDTGGAIRGPVRGDIFFGTGQEAEWRAGHMKGQGSYAVLLPAALSARLAGGN